MNEMLIDNWSGGEVGIAAERCAPNEAVSMVNWMPGDDGSLISYPGNNRYFANAYSMSPAITADTGDGCDFITLNSNTYAANTYMDTLWVYDGTYVWPICPLTAVDSATRTWFVRAEDNTYVGNTNVLKCVSTYYNTGTVTCAGGTGAVTGNGTAWLTSLKVNPGNVMYFVAAGVVYGPYYLKQVASDTSLVLTANGPALTGASYIITNARSAGIAPPTAAITNTAGMASGGSMGEGIHLITYTYGNSNSGYESNQCTAADLSITATSGNKTAVLEGWPTAPSDTQIDQIKIYATAGAGSIKKLVTTLTRGGTTDTTYTFAADYTYDMADTSLGVTLAVNHDPPPSTVNGGAFFAGKLFLYSGATIYVSRRGAYEYFSTDSIDEMEDIMGYTDIQPGVIVCGHGNIMGLLPESGAYLNTGESGGSLIVLKDSGNFYRIAGEGMRTWERMEAFESSCVSYRSHQVVGGVMFWVSNEGPMALEVGSNQPVPIYEKRWPNGSPFATGNNTLIMSCRRRSDEYVFTYPAVGSTTCDTIMVYNWKKKLFYRVSASGGSVYGMCTNPATGTPFFSETARMWQMFTQTSAHTYINGGVGTTGIPVTLKHGIIYGQQDEDKNKTVKVWSVRANNPTSTQTLTGKLYEDGNATANTSSTFTMTTSASLGRIAAIAFPHAYGCGFQPELTGTLTDQVILESMELEYTTHGRATGR